MYPPPPLLCIHGHRGRRHHHIALYKPGHLDRESVAWAELATDCWLVPFTDTGILLDLDVRLRNNHCAHFLLQWVRPAPSLRPFNHVVWKMAGRPFQGFWSEPGTRNR